MALTSQVIKFPGRPAQTSFSPSALSFHLFADWTLSECVIVIVIQFKWIELGFGKLWVEFWLLRCYISPTLSLSLPGWLFFFFSYMNWVQVKSEFIKMTSLVIKFPGSVQTSFSPPALSCFCQRERVLTWHSHSLKMSWVQVALELNCILAENFSSSLDRIKFSWLDLTGGGGWPLF